MIDALQSPVATHRVEAARALGKLGSRALDAVPLLNKALEDEDPRVTRSAAQALQQISPQTPRAPGDR